MINFIIDHISKQLAKFVFLRVYKFVGKFCKQL